MTDEQFAILDSRIQMLALSLVAGMIFAESADDEEHLIKAIIRARRIVFDARTSADAGTYR